jgi:hypothetical protein
LAMNWINCPYFSRGLNKSVPFFVFRETTADVRGNGFPPQAYRHGRGGRFFPDSQQIPTDQCSTPK